MWTYFLVSGNTGFETSKNISILFMVENWPGTKKSSFSNYLANHWLA